MIKNRKVFEVIEYSFEKERKYLEALKEQTRLPSPPVAIHHHSGKIVLRKLAWRMVEVLSQTADYYFEHLEGQDPEILELRNKSLIKAYRIVIQIMLFSGVSPSSLNFKYLEDTWITTTSYERATWESVSTAGIAIARLRDDYGNGTSEENFRKQMEILFDTHIMLWGCLRLTQNELEHYITEEHA